MSHRVESTAEIDLPLFPFGELSLLDDLFYFAHTSSVLLLKIPGVVLREPAQPALGGKKRLRAYFLNTRARDSFQTFSASFLTRAAELVHDSQTQWLGGPAAAASTATVSIECLRDMFVPMVPPVSSSTTEAYLPLTIGSDPVLCYDHARVPIENTRFLSGDSDSDGGSDGGSSDVRHVLVLVQPRLVKSNPSEPLFRVELVLLQCMVIPPPPIEPPAAAAGPSSSSSSSSSLAPIAPPAELLLSSPLPELPELLPEILPAALAPAATAELPCFSSLEELQDDINEAATHSDDFLMQQALQSLESNAAADGGGGVAGDGLDERETRKRKWKEAERRCREKMRELVRLQTEVLDLKKAYVAVSDALSPSDSDDPASDDEDDDEDEDEEDEDAAAK